MVITDEGKLRYINVHVETIKYINLSLSSLLLWLLSSFLTNFEYKDKSQFACLYVKHLIYLSIAIQ